jgi:hypothetical protein
MNDIKLEVDLHLSKKFENMPREDLIEEITCWKNKFNMFREEEQAKFDSKVIELENSHKNDLQTHSETLQKWYNSKLENNEALNACKGELEFITEWNREKTDRIKELNDEIENLKSDLKDIESEKDLLISKLEKQLSIELSRTAFDRFKTTHLIDILYSIVVIISPFISFTLGLYLLLKGFSDGGSFAVIAGGLFTIVASAILVSCLRGSK